MDPGASPPRHNDAVPGSSALSALTPPGLVQSTEGESQRPRSNETGNDHDTNGQHVTDSPTVSGQDQATEDVEEPRPSFDSSTRSIDTERTISPTDPATSPPPFWSPSTAHTRSISYHSIRRPSGTGPIQLEDHSEEDHVQTQSCWAESATIDEHVVVSGPTGIGAYVVWHCTVKTLKGGDLEIRKRYSEFDTLRANLVRSFPHAEAMIPELPRKSVVSRFRPRFLEARKRGLGHFLNCILLNPEFASSPVLKDFVFS